jgi:pimeloyl-ACP methyl ester carboxylesterase
MSEPPLLHEPVATETLLLYGPDDHVVGPDFVAFCERAFPNRIGPLAVPGAGHFLPWERADVFNPLLAAVFGDLTRAR